MRSLSYRSDFLLVNFVCQRKQFDTVAIKRWRTRFSHLSMFVLKAEIFTPLHHPAATWFTVARKSIRTFLRSFHAYIIQNIWKFHYHCNEYRDCAGNVWNGSEDICKSYKTLVLEYFSQPLHSSILRCLHLADFILASKLRNFIQRLTALQYCFNVL